METNIITKKSGFSDPLPAAALTSTDENRNWRPLEFTEDFTKTHPTAHSDHDASYGGNGFEGMRCSLDKDKVPRIFNPRGHWERMCVLCTALGIPIIPYDMFLDALERVVKNYYHTLQALNEDQFLYLRPSISKKSRIIGVYGNTDYRFIVYSAIRTVIPHSRARMYLETTTQFSDAQTQNGRMKGGFNYALRSLCEDPLIHSGNWDCVLWTCKDIANPARRIVQEFGILNVFFVENSVLITPALDDSFLPGKTRELILTLAKHASIPCIEKTVYADEFLAGIQSKHITEIFGSGTAANGIQQFEKLGGDIIVPHPVFFNESPVAKNLQGYIQKVYSGDLFPELTHPVQM